MQLCLHPSPSLSPKVNASYHFMLDLLCVHSRQKEHKNCRERERDVATDSFCMESRPLYNRIKYIGFSWLSPLLTSFPDASGMALLLVQSKRFFLHWAINPFFTQMVVKI